MQINPTPTKIRRRSSVPHCNNAQRLFVLTGTDVLKWILSVRSQFIKPMTLYSRKKGGGGGGVVI